MKILLTGATGYIGKRILPHLIDNGHFVVCCVRDKKHGGEKLTLVKSLNDSDEWVDAIIKIINT